MKKTQKNQRYRLTQRQCLIFLKDMREFGFDDLTLDEVRKIADDYADGGKVEGVIQTILDQQITEALKSVG